MFTMRSDAFLRKSLVESAITRARRATSYRREMKPFRRKPPAQLTKPEMVTEPEMLATGDEPPMMMDPWDLEEIAIGMDETEEPDDSWNAKESEEGEGL